MTAERRRLVVIDTDPGIDDLQAISMLVAADQRGELTVVAVTTVAGNVSVKHCTRNVRRILDLLDRLDIPIFAGAHCPLFSEDSRCTNQHYFGKNGLGDVHCDRPLPNTKQRDEHAVSALVRLAREHKGELNIVGLGPLTNLALATRMDPEFVNNINDLYIMGGNKTGVGNISATGEFNFLSDPEAARLTLATVRRPVTVCCWEVCYNNPMDLQWRRQVLGAADSPLARFFDEIERSSLKNSETAFHGKWISCDTLAAAAFVRPEVVLKKTEYHAEVETHGVATRGQMVVDRRFWQTAPKHNVSIVEEVDMDLYKRMLLDAFGHPDVKF